MAEAVAPVQLGNLRLPVPVILAPMAGVTTSAFRRLCREQAESATSARPAGIFTCEMITARAIVERNQKTIAMMTPDPGDPIRSVQLYGTDPATIGQAVAVIAGDFGVNHVDLNFGCPVPKVTRKGGGGVLPWKLGHFRSILAAAVRAAEPYGIPVTAKTRVGIDDEHITFLEAGRVAEEAGCAAISLHARTVDQAYSGQADWSRIAELVEALTIPVFGNGDVWEASDALAMISQTGCAGVMIGRGSLGRPWLFRDLAAALSRGQADVPDFPNLGQVIAMARRHGQLLIDQFGSEAAAMTDLRKHMSWYFKGFRMGGDHRHDLALISSLADFDRIVADCDPTETFPPEHTGAPRGRQGSRRRKVIMPTGWLDSRD